MAPPVVLVVDDELLIGELLELVADDARQRIRRPTGRENHDVLHRLVGPVVGRAGDARGDHRRSERAARQDERATARQDYSLHCYETSAELFHGGGVYRSGVRVQQRNAGKNGA